MFELLEIVALLRCKVFWFVVGAIAFICMIPCDFIQNIIAFIVALVILCGIVVSFISLLL